MDVELQLQARALGDPTRHKIFRYVVDAGRRVDVAELTAHFGLNHNAIRQHLNKLTEAELLTEEAVASGGPGRPKLCYTLAATADSRWDITGPYERLSLLLAEVIRTGDSPVEVGRRAGRRRQLGPLFDDDPVGGLVDQMARYGFDPTVNDRAVDGGTGTVNIILRTCPYASTALADPETVCGLHLGIAYGVAEMLDGVEVDELRPHDPRRANCVLRCHTTSHQP
ncbi:MAG: helix-turn-helix domain-containing protein [Ilumatobacteraceae bacterium]